MDLRELWETHAAQWIEWASAAGHDSYWSFHRDQFLQVVPPPGRRTIDIGCGEGRLTRCLKELGHNVVGVDTSPRIFAEGRTAVCLYTDLTNPFSNRCYGTSDSH